ncbi:MAG: hypothetical protein ACT4OS_02010 [Acidimicrobiales bacterium]
MLYLDTASELVAFYQSFGFETGAIAELGGTQDMACSCMVRRPSTAGPTGIDTDARR